MTVKELRQSLRRSSFVIPFIAVHLFATIAIVVEFETGIGGSSGGSWSLGPFWSVALITCGLLMPMAGFFLMPQETDEGNHELLQLTPLTRWHIIRGKFLMLWGLSVLTFLSLLPYVVIRYFLGGIEWFHEANHALAVISCASVLSSGALGASSFSSIGARLGVFLLFLFSLLFGGVSGIASGAMAYAFGATSSWGWLLNIYTYFTIVCVVTCYSILGLLLARSRLRVATMNFELKPAKTMLVIIGLSPFVIGIIAAMSCGFGSFAGVILMTFLAWNCDITPKAPKWMPPPPPNIPPPPLPPEPAG